MTDRDRHTPNQGSGPGPDNPDRPPAPPSQPPYAQRPYGQDPYAPPPGAGGRPPYPPGRPPYGGQQRTPPGANPYERHPYGAPSQPPRPQEGPPGPARQPYTDPAYRPGFAQPPAEPQYLPPLYLREDGVAGPGFALPDAYKTPVAERPGPEPKPFLRLNRPARIILSVVALVVGTGVAVGLPYRQQLQDYQKHKKAVLSYKVVPKNGVGVIDGVKFALGSFGKGDLGLQFQAPAGTTAVKALIGHRAPDQQTEDRVETGVEYVFRDARGRTWIAQSEPGPSKGKVKSDEIKALVPTAVAGQVRPVVRPRQQLDPGEDPTQIPRGPALEFQR